MFSIGYDDRRQALPTSPGRLGFHRPNNIIATPVPDNINPYQARNSGASLLDSEKILLVAVASQVSESPEYDPKDPKIIELNNRKRQEKVETSCGLSPPPRPPFLSRSLARARSLSLSLSLAAHSTTPGRGANSGETPQAKDLDCTCLV